MIIIITIIIAIGSHESVPKPRIFLKALGLSLTLATDNPMETAYLFQRLSVALRRFNAECILGCFCGKQNDVDYNNNIFVLFLNFHFSTSLV